MAAGKDAEGKKQNKRGTLCNVVVSQEMCPPGHTPIIFNPDFFVEKLRHIHPESFTELVLSNITRLIDLPGTEFAQLLGDVDPKLPSAGGFFRSFNFLKRKEKGVVFGAPLTEEGIAQICQLIEYLSRNLHVEGLFRVPGNSIRQQALREMLDSGVDIDLETGDYHPNDVASLLKSFLGELPEPLVTHRHYHAHLKIADLMLFDEHGNKTTLPDKERRIEALQLLLLLLPPTNRSLLKLLLDLLYQTARRQDTNKMSAFNLALMFAPHIMWPKNMTATDLQGNIKKLNEGMAFLIKHSQKLFRAPAYIRDHARRQLVALKIPQSKDDLDLLPASMSATPSKRPCQDPGANPHTEEALKELFHHVNNLPESAKKKKYIRQLAKGVTPGTPGCDCQTPPTGKKHPRSRSFGGLIKKRVLGSQAAAERRGQGTPPSADVPTEGHGKENPSRDATQRGHDSAVVTNPAVCPKAAVVCGDQGSSITNVWFIPTQESSV